MRKQQKDTQQETCQQSAGCKTTPEPPFSRRKIIPFPGVSFSEPAGFQNELDDFLQEMGYVD